MSNALIIYLGGRRVGSLELGEGRAFVFRYHAEWLNDPRSIPLSIALPLREEPYADVDARPFFTNLLPEEELRKVIARRFGISPANDFALLEALGGECAGAVTLLPEGETPGEEGEYRFLDDDELTGLASELPKRPLFAGEAGVRLSLAGVQNKLPVRYDPLEEHVYLPTGNRASTHILKTPIAHLPETVENELFCMKLAVNMGLPAPWTGMLRRGTPLYLVSRYDRETGPEGRTVRRHQEDFCQALGIPPEIKYEKEGGPGLKACFELVRAVSIQPVIDIRALLGWVIFNYLIGNADAHGKNVSMLLTDNGPKLAPFYDLLSTAVYPQLSESLAMKIGGRDDPKWINEDQWKVFAEESGIGYKLVRQTLLSMSEEIVDHAEEMKTEWEMRWDCGEITDKIVKVIRQRAAKVKRVLSLEVDETPADPHSE